MTAYVVGKLRVRNWDWYKQYRAVTEPLVAKYGGKYIIKGGDPESLEGDGAHALVVIEFSDRQEARQWYEDSEYAAMIELRKSSGVETDLLLVDGI